MKHLSFRTQGYISLVILAGTFLLEQFFRVGVLHNIAWIIIGLLFAVNPVWPKAWDWQEQDKLKKGIRVGSVIVIVVFGFLTRYGV